MNEPVTVTYALEEVLKEIKQEIKDVNTKLEKMDERFTKIEIDMAEVKTELKGMNKRLDSQEFINRSVAIGVIVGLTTGVVKLFFPNFLNLPH